MRVRYWNVEWYIGNDEVFFKRSFNERKDKLYFLN